MSDLPALIHEEIEPAAQASDALRAIRAAVAGADTERAELAEVGDWQRLAIGLAFAKTLTADLRLLVQSIEADVAALMPDKVCEVLGVGTLERRKGTDRKAWQSPELLSAVVRQAIDPEGTGELPSGPDLIEAVMGAVLDTMPVTASMGWKVTGLRARGFDPDQWCESKPGRTSVQIHGEGLS